MKVFIIKPKTKKIDQKLIKNLQKFYSNAEITSDINAADLYVMQHGWCHSKTAVGQYLEAKKLNKKIQEDYIYLDQFQIHLN